MVTALRNTALPCLPCKTIGSACRIMCKSAVSARIAMCQDSTCQSAAANCGSSSHHHVVACGLDVVEQRLCCLCHPLQSIPQDRHKIVVSADGMMPARSGSYAADEEDFKYARRAHPLKRTLQRLFPSMFAPGLPVTARCAAGLG
jgi:hypothetical protein